MFSDMAIFIYFFWHQRMAINELKSGVVDLNFAQKKNYVITFELALK